jgi:hypothetical protein
MKAMKAICMSKVFGPTDSVADTLTALAPAAGYQFPAGKSFTIVQIRVGKGNVVNAKECSGFISINIPGVVGTPFAFAYGNGIGGATNSNNSAAEDINVNIPVPPNSIVTVLVLDAEAAKNVTVSLMCQQGGGNAAMFTLAAGGAGQDTAAATAYTLTVNAKLLGPNMTPFRGGVIRQIRFAGSGAVDAKAATAKLVLEISGYPDPLEFAVGKGPGGATLGTQSDADVIEDLAIPIAANSTIVAKVTSAEIMLSASLSMQVQ